jgi:hypothetical protein
MVWVVTFFLILTAVSGWLFLRRDPERYIHEKTSPINIFFKWGRFWHHIFKMAIIALFMLAIFSLYKYLLAVSNTFAGSAALTAGAVLAGGKELLDKAITLDDVVSSAIGIIFGFLIIYLFFWM